MSTIRGGNRLVGDDQPCFIIAEIGINHNGDIDLAKRLISVAVAAGCDAVKFQKRTIDVVYTAKELAAPRETPFGTTNADLMSVRDEKGNTPLHLAAVGGWSRVVGQLETRVSTTRWPMR